MSGAIDYYDGFDTDQLRQDFRMYLLDLNDDDHATAKRLHERVIMPRLELIIAGFYDRLNEVALFHEIMGNGFDVAALRKTQSEYLCTLGLGFDTAEYFERRLRVGLVHDRVGVPLSLYLCAMHMLQQLIIENLRAAISDVKEERLLGDFIHRILALDMSLAIEAYHRARMNSMEQSIEQLGAQAKAQRQRAQTDALTGVISRAYFFEQLARRLGPHRDPLCLAVADLDHFKLVNDRYGHLAGDDVLREVAGRIKAGFRDFDLIGRYGGEEFAILIECNSLSQAHEICERVRQRIALTPINVGDARVSMTASFGIARADAADTPETLFARADQAMYAAKSAGRNCVCAEDDVARS